MEELERKSREGGKREKMKAGQVRKEGGKDRGEGEAERREGL
jgi:hypothetical protein